MSEGEAPIKHTVFVTGGVYERLQHGETISGSIVGCRQMPNGIRVGMMYSAGHAPERVMETKTLDDWKLVSRPIPIELYEQLKYLAANAEGLTSLLRDLPVARRVLAGGGSGGASIVSTPTILTERAPVTLPPEPMDVERDDEDDDLEDDVGSQEDEEPPPAPTSLSERVAQIAEQPATKTAPKPPQSAMDAVRSRRKAAV